MKLVTFFSTFLACAFISVSAHAGSCASNQAQLNNISAMTSIADPFGEWHGISGGKPIHVSLSINAAGRFQGIADFDGQHFGPLGMQLCDNGNSYTFTISFFTIEFDILTSDKIRIHFSLDDSSDTVVLTRK